MIRLEYIGHILTNDPTSPRMWNIVAPGHWRDGSTVELETLQGEDGYMGIKALILSTAASILLTGCSRDPGEQHRVPGQYFSMGGSMCSGDVCGGQHN